MVCVRVQLHSSACGYPAFPSPFVEETVPSPLNSRGTVVRNQLILYMGLYVGLHLYSKHRYICSHASTTVLMTGTL